VLARRTQPKVFLGLVGTGPRYRPPLDLRRPELAAAFASGQRDRDAGRHGAWLEDAAGELPTREEVEAYALGRATAADAPPPAASQGMLVQLPPRRGLRARETAPRCAPEFVSA
jgi:hypothetical protein